MRACFFLPAALALLAPAAAAATIHVPGDHPKIQQAIDAAIDGDEVWVAPGTYVENIRYKGRAVIVKSTEGPGKTWIDGNHAKGLSTVSFIDQEGFGSVLEGFTVTNGAGTAVKEYGVLGGGICIGWKDGASPIIRGNVVTGNEAECGGGIGIFGGDSMPVIQGNVIQGNTIDGESQGYLSGFGAGIGGTCFLAEIVYNIISDNIAVGGLYERSFGGGIGIFWADSAIIWNNTVTGNQAATLRNFGGGIFCAAAHAYMVNNIVAGNEAQGSEARGGGIYCDFEPVLVNNTVAANSAFLGGGLYLDGGAPEIRNTILFGNAAGEGPEIWMGGYASTVISHSDILGGQASIHMEPGCSLDWGPGMIDADPLFVDAAAGDYHLLFTSPCRDAGDSASSPGKDFEDDPRILPDIGADEFHTHLYAMGDTTPGGAVVVKLVGQPGTSPVGLCFGSGVLEIPLKSIFGAWYLKFPIIGPVPLAPIPADGVEVLNGTLPLVPAGPYSIPMQALIGFELSNLFVMEVK